MLEELGDVVLGQTQQVLVPTQGPTVLATHLVAIPHRHPFFAPRRRLDLDTVQGARMFQHAALEPPPLTKEEGPLWRLDFALKDFVHGGGERLRDEER